MDKPAAAQKPRSWASRLFRLAIVVAVLAGAEYASRRMSPRWDHKRNDPAAIAAIHALRNAVREHERSSATLPPEARVRRWLGLVSRFTNIDGDLDYAPQNDLLQEVFAALPPRDDWPVLDAELRRSATPADRLNPHWLVLSALSHWLNGRRTELRQDADQLARVVAALGWGGDWGIERLRAAARRLDDRDDGELTRLIGEPTHREHRRRGTIPVPELFDRMPEAKAREALRQAMLLSYPVHVARGSRTEKEARVLALDLVGQLQVPHWSLACGLDQGALFAALERRFPTTLAHSRSERGWWDERERKQAIAYRVVDHLRRSDVERARSLAEWLRSGKLGFERELCGPAEELARAGDLKTLGALKHFAFTLWTADAAPHDWYTYDRIARLAGRMDRLGTVLNAALRRESGWGASSLHDRLAAYHLHHGSVDGALPLIREKLRVLLKLHEAGERSANIWLATAVELVELGQLLQRPDLVREARDEIARCPPGASLERGCGSSPADLPECLLVLTGPYPPEGRSLMVLRPFKGQG